MSTLTPRGFKLFTLGALPIAEQIAIIRGAQIIVAPHGMGLTHCAFHQGGLRLIELVNPRIGMDAYAAMSRAFGFDYECLIGEALPNTLDFRVSPHALRALLD
jgi:capsular polysaccharide biosynthesis protein